MHSTARLPPAPAALPFFAWAIPPECQWWDIAGRDPTPQIARDLLQALAAPHSGRASAG